MFRAFWATLGFPSRPPVQPPPTPSVPMVMQSHIQALDNHRVGSTRAHVLNPMKHIRYLGSVRLDHTWPHNPRVLDFHKKVLQVMQEEVAQPRARILGFDISHLGVLPGGAEEAVHYITVLLFPTYASSRKRKRTVGYKVEVYDSGSGVYDVFKEAIVRKWLYPHFLDKLMESALFRRTQPGLDFTSRGYKIQLCTKDAFCQTWSMIFMLYLDYDLDTMPLTTAQARFNNFLDVDDANGNKREVLKEIAENYMQGWLKYMYDETQLLPSTRDKYQETTRDRVTLREFKTMINKAIQDKNW